MEHTLNSTFLTTTTLSSIMFDLLLWLVGKTKAISSSCFKITIIHKLIKYDQFKSWFKSYQGINLLEFSISRGLCSKKT